MNKRKTEKNTPPNSHENKITNFHAPVCLFDAFAQVFESSRGSQLSDEYLKNASLPLTYISEKMGISLRQSVLLSIVLERTDQGASKRHFCRHLGFDGIFVYSFLKEINSLAERGIIEFVYCAGFRIFFVTQHAMDSIVDNAVYTVPEKRERFKPKYNDDDSNGNSNNDDIDNWRPSTSSQKSYTDIEQKNLFYNEEVQPQMDTLFGLLKGNNLHKVQARLAKNKLRTGICCLLYGPPGTGKTESVLQLAKKTKRDILMVNLSELRSQWLGESEKLCQKLWDDYEQCVEHSDRTPILLLNECDAILAKRSQGNIDSTDKCENTIANIFLENMEKQRGIVIATTNLVGNLDAAFDRRFMYKVHMDQPSPRVRQLIWKTMLPDLSDGDAANIAKEFSLSGGQIENVTRKMFVDNVLQNKKVTLNAAREICKQEISNNANPSVIGFKK